MAVHARPMTTPGGVTSYIRSCLKVGLPTSSDRLSSVTVILSASFFTTLYATFRAIC